MKRPQGLLGHWLNLLYRRDWTDPAGTLLIAGGVLTFLFALIRLSFSVFLEGALLTAIVVLVLSLQPLRESVRCWPRGWRISATTLLVLVVGGQLYGREQDIFPFTKWDMFTTGEQREVIPYLEFIGRRADGTEVRFVAKSGGMFTIRRWIGMMARDMSDPQLTEQRRERAGRRFDEYGPLVLEVYNREHPREPILSYKVYENYKYLKEHPRVDRVLIGAWPLEKEAR